MIRNVYTYAIFLIYRIQKSTQDFIIVVISVSVLYLETQFKFIPIYHYVKSGLMKVHNGICPGVHFI